MIPLTWDDVRGPAITGRPIASEGMSVPVIRSRGEAGAFHDRSWGPLEGPQIWVHQVERPALVLGSTQRDPAEWVGVGGLGGAWGGDTGPGVEIAGRRSGGGMVTIDPERTVWIDVLLPHGHARWDDDVTRSFLWVGRAWARALTRIGLSGVVHDGPTSRSAWGRQVCFAGLGSGEVTVDGHKVVGLSQRRTRHGARIQSLATADGLPAWFTGLVRRDALEPDLAAELERLPIGRPFDPPALEMAAVDELTRALGGP